MRRGASGFVLKDTPPEQLPEAIKVVAAGGALLAPDVTRVSRLLAKLNGRDRARLSSPTRPAGNTWALQSGPVGSHDNVVCGNSSGSPPTAGMDVIGRVRVGAAATNTATEAVLAEHGEQRRRVKTVFAALTSHAARRGLNHPLQPATSVRMVFGPIKAKIGASRRCHVRSEKPETQVTFEPLAMTSSVNAVSPACCKSKTVARPGSKDRQ